MVGTDCVDKTSRVRVAFVGACITVALCCWVLLPAYGGPLAPDFTLKDFDGNTVSLKDFRGEVVLINFWASWCPPCRAEIPQLIQLHNRQHHGLVILGVNLAERKEDDGPTFANAQGIPYLLLHDRNNTVAARYGVQGIPTNVLIDRSGAIVQVYIGYSNESNFESSVVQNILEQLAMPVERKGKAVTAWAKLKQS